MPESQLTAKLHLQFLRDVADAIDIDRLARALKIEPESRTHPSPHAVQFEKPPVTEPWEPLTLSSGERVNVCLRYYEFGIIATLFELQVCCDWDKLSELAAGPAVAAELERHAGALIDQKIQTLKPFLTHPYAAALTEDYWIVEIAPISSNGGYLRATELIQQFGSHISRMVRGEKTLLSDQETAEVLESAISYYPHDLFVAGWSTAFVCDSPDAAALTLRLLEYANVQLLEFRHYDNVLTQVLAAAYDSVDPKASGWWRRWGMASKATELNQLLLEVREITERIDNSIKFLSDMYSARLFRLAAVKVGVPDYRTLVDEKLALASDVYRFLNDQFNHARAFVLELIVVIILIIDLIVLFRDKH